MILVPYFVDSRNENWISLGIFLSQGGREPWTVNDTENIKKVLSENGFPLKKLIKGKISYAIIDHTCLKLNDFYIWDEIDPEKASEDVWRIFRIPKALWGCQIFKEKFWLSVNLPFSFEKDKIEIS